jgi:cytochrome c peroxidase
MARKRAVYVITSEQAKEFNGRRAWSGRYDSIDASALRPIHSNMSVAPPWARKLNRKNR